jgi:hypothetical protein
VRVGERCASRRQAIHVRRLRLRVPFQRPHPIIQIINGDEEDVRLLRRRANQYAESEEEATKKAFHATYSTG